MSRARAWALSFAFGFLAMFLVIGRGLLANKGFGASDLPFVALHGVPVLLFAPAAVELMLAFWKSRRGSIVQTFAGCAIGLSIGLAYAVFIFTRVIGVGAPSLPMLPAWMLGGCFAGGTSVWFRNSENALSGARLWSIALLAALVAIAYEPLYVRLSGEQELELVFLRWQPADQFLEASAGGVPVAGADLDFLRSLGVRGWICGLGRSAIGAGPKATAYFLFTQPIQDEVTVQQPQRTKVAFQFWGGISHQLPRDARLREETIKIRWNQRSASMNFEVAVPGATVGGDTGWQSGKCFDPVRQ